MAFHKSYFIKNDNYAREDTYTLSLLECELSFGFRTHAISLLIHELF